MQEIKSIPFRFEDKEYEIRVFSDGTTFQVQAFRQGKRANGYAYTVDYMTSASLRQNLGMDAVEHLIRIAKNDIKEKVWERLLEARRKTE